MLTWHACKYKVHKLHQRSILIQQMKGIDSTWQMPHSDIDLNHMWYLGPGMQVNTKYIEIKSSTWELFHKMINLLILDCVSLYSVSIFVFSVQRFFTCAFLVFLSHPVNIFVFSVQKFFTCAFCMFPSWFAVMGVDLFFEVPATPMPEHYVYNCVSVPILVTVQMGFRPVPRVHCDWMGVLANNLNQGWRLIEIFMDMTSHTRVHALSFCGFERGSH